MKQTFVRRSLQSQGGGALPHGIQLVHKGHEKVCQLILQGASCYNTTLQAMRLVTPGVRAEICHINPILIQILGIKCLYIYIFSYFIQNSYGLLEITQAGSLILRVCCFFLLPFICIANDNSQ